MFESASTTPEPSRGPAVLVVEDQAPLRRLYRHMLETLGYRVVLAEGGAHALDLVERGGLRPDVLLTDVVMPGLDGPALAARLRALLPGLRVVYMSGYAGDALGAHGLLECGAPYLQKPFDAAELGSRLAEAAAPPSA